MKMVLVINSLGFGGAERVMSVLLREWSKRDDLDITLLLLDEDEIAYDFHGVKVICCECSGSHFKSFYGIFANLYKLKPDVVVSFLSRSNVYSTIICRMLSIKCVISERSDTVHRYGNRSNHIEQFLVRKLYPKADLIIAVSDGVRSSLVKFIKSNSLNIRVINNPVDHESLYLLANELVDPELDLKGNDYYIAVGRLIKTKEFDLLIRAFSKASTDRRLLILGDGPERKNLQKLVHSLNLSNRVIINGFEKNPFKYMKHAYAFVSASSLEGFPNVLVEAMTFSLPVLAANCMSGPYEIITDSSREEITRLKIGSYGVLVPVGDVDELVAAFNLIEKENELRERLSDASLTRSKDYSLSKVSSSYMEAILQ